MIPAPIQSSPSDLLEDYANPALSLLDIANKRDLSLPELAALISRPDIQERLAALESAAAQRVRCAASFHLSAAIQTLKLVVDQYNDRAARNDLPTDPDRRHRTTESARRACSTLVRLSRFVPMRHTPGDDRPPQPHRHSRPPIPEPTTGPAAQPARDDAPLQFPAHAPTPTTAQPIASLPSPALSPARIADLITSALATGQTVHERTAPLLALLDSSATLNGAPVPGHPAYAARALVPIAASPLAPAAAPPPVISGAAAHISRTFSTPRGQATLQLKLSRRPNSAHPNCWLIASIRFRPPDTPTQRAA